jgi:hypothetical protein
MGIALCTWPAVRTGYLLDDELNIFGNARMRNAHGLLELWTSRQQPDYLPLTWTLFWVEHHLFGNAPLGYHVVSLGLHLVGALLLWQCLLALRLRGAWWAALFFAIHPINVTSLAWISETKNTLSLVFYAASALLYVRERRASSLVCLALALLCKASGVTLPLVLLALDYWRYPGKLRPRAAGLVPHLVVAGAGACVAGWFPGPRRHRGGSGAPRRTGAAHRGRRLHRGVLRLEDFSTVGLELSVSTLACGERFTAVLASHAAGAAAAGCVMDATSAVGARSVLRPRLVSSAFVAGAGFCGSVLSSLLAGGGSVGLSAHDPAAGRRGVGSDWCA